MAYLKAIPSSKIDGNKCEPNDTSRIHCKTNEF